MCQISTLQPSCKGENVEPLSKNSANDKKVNLLGIILGVCIIAVVLVAYGQISILQKNTSTLEADNSTFKPT